MSEIDAAPVWERFLRFETRQAARGGNVKAFRQVEKRYLEAYDAMPEFTKSGFGVPGASRMHRHLALGLAPSGSVDKQCLERLAIRSVDPLTGTSYVSRLPWSGVTVGYSDSAPWRCFASATVAEWGFRC